MFLPCPGRFREKKSQFKLLGGLHILSRCLFNGTYFDFQKFTGHRRDVIDFALGAKLKRLFDLQFALLDEFDRNVIIIVYENAKCCTCFFFLLLEFHLIETFMLCFVFLLELRLDKTYDLVCNITNVQIHVLDMLIFTFH